MLTISYINFWSDVGNIQDVWFTEFIKQNIDSNIKIVSNNPDILICSCFGDISKVYKITAKVKIFFYGENLNKKNYSQYKDFKVLKNVFDLILGFKYTNLENKIIRFPLWLLYYPFYKYDKNNNVLNYIQKNYSENLKINKNNASIVASHDKGGERTIIYNEVIKYVNILSPGKFKNNSKPIKSGNKNKIEFIKNTIFNICPENSEYEGYCTEKIFQSLEAGCIPLYWGISKPEPDLLNDKCYCFINIKDTNDVKNKIKNVCENKNTFTKEKIFLENSENIIKNYYENLKEQILILLNK